MPLTILTPTPAELRAAAFSTFMSSKSLGIVAGVFVVIFALLLATKIIKSLISKIFLALLIAGIAAGILYYYSLITIRF